MYVRRAHYDDSDGFLALIFPRTADSIGLIDVGQDGGWRSDVQLPECRDGGYGWLRRTLALR